MNAEKLINIIAGMRDRKAVQAIANAADARDICLLSHESARLSKRVFARYAHLKRGDQVFVHQPKHRCGMRAHLHGLPLVVHAVHPKNRSIEVCVPGFAFGGHVTVKLILRWSVLKSLKVSDKPTSEALEYILKGPK